MPVPQELIDALLIVKQYNATLRQEGRIERSHEAAEAALENTINDWDQHPHSPRQAVLEYYRNPPKEKRFRK